LEKGTVASITSSKRGQVADLLHLKKKYLVLACSQPLTAEDLQRAISEQAKPDLAVYQGGAGK
jgi:hypothetical protein